MILEEDFAEDGFSDIEAFDAFMDVVAKHPNRSKPSEIENYINDCKAFFRTVYSIGVIDGFTTADNANNALKNFKDEE